MVDWNEKIEQAKEELKAKNYKNAFRDIRSFMNPP